MTTNFIVVDLPDNGSKMAANVECVEMLGTWSEQNSLYFISLLHNYTYFVIFFEFKSKVVIFQYWYKIFSFLESLDLTNSVVPTEKAS